MSNYKSKRLCRNGDKKIITGVCAGVADYCNLPVNLVRGVSVAGLIFLSVPTALAYLLASLLLPEVRALNNL